MEILKTNVMKKTFNKTQMLLLVVAIFGSLSLSSCKDDEVEQAGSEAVLTDFSPTSGKKETMLTLNGEHIGASRKNVHVWINDTEADVINVTQTKINVRVPAKAGSGPIRVKIGDKEFTYPTSFEYLPNYTYTVTSYAGSGARGYVDGPVETAQFHNTRWLACDPKDGMLYTLETDFGSTPSRVRRVKNGAVETVVNFKDAHHTVKLNNPRTIEFSITGDTIFVSNDNGNNIANLHAVAILTRADDFKVIKEYVTSANAGSPNLNYAGINPADGSLVYYSWLGKIYTWDNETKTATELADVLPIYRMVHTINGSYASLRFSPDGRTLYVISRNDYQGVLRAGYNLTAKTLDTPFERFAGTGKWGTNDGVGVEAGMDFPSQGAFGTDGDLYIVEFNNHCVRRVKPNGEVSVFAGILRNAGYVDGDISVAKFHRAYGFTIDKYGNMYVADTNIDADADKVNNRIRKITVEEDED